MYCCDAHSFVPSVHDILQHVGRVVGLALTADGSTLYFTDTNTGTIVRLATSGLVADPDTGLSNHATLRREIVLSGLDDPRGLALDEARGRIFFTEKAGRIYECNMDGTNMEPNAARPPRFRDLLVKRPSRARLDGLTLDLTGTRRSTHMIYWSESNTNMIMRSNIYGRNVRRVAGLDGSLVWPRGAFFYDSALYFSEYLGGVKRIPAPKTLATSEPTVEKLVDMVGSASSFVAQEVLAVTRVGGEFVFAVND